MCARAISGSVLAPSSVVVPDTVGWERAVEGSEWISILLTAEEYVPGTTICPVGFAVLRPILTTLRCAMIGVAVLAQVPVHRGKIPALRASNTGVGRLKQKTFFEFSSTGDRRSAPGWMGHWCFWAGAAVARLPERYMWVGASGILRPATWSTSLEEEEGAGQD